MSEGKHDTSVFGMLLPRTDLTDDAKRPEPSDTSLALAEKLRIMICQRVVPKGRASWRRKWADPDVAAVLDKFAAEAERRGALAQHGPKWGDATCQQGQPCPDSTRCPDPVGCNHKPEALPGYAVGTLTQREADEHAAIWAVHDVAWPPDSRNLEQRNLAATAIMEALSPAVPT